MHIGTYVEMLCDFLSSLKHKRIITPIYEESSSELLLGKFMNEYLLQFVKKFKYNSWMEFRL